MKKIYLSVITLLTLSAILSSCTPDNNDSDSDGGDRLVWTGHSKLLYDNNGRVSTLVHTMGGYWDSTYFFYDAGGKISHAWSREGFVEYDSPHKQPFFFSYTGNKITKVYRKQSANYDMPYYNDPTYLLTFDLARDRNFLVGYDSIIYDIRDRVTAVYHKEGDGSIASYEALNYNNPSSDPGGGGDSLLYTVQHFEGLPDGTFKPRDKLIFYKYDLNRLNPLHKYLKEFAFMYPSVTPIEVQPEWDLQSGALDRYLTLNPHPAVLYGFDDAGDWNTYEVRNVYNKRGQLDTVDNRDFGFLHNQTVYTYQ